MPHPADGAALAAGLDLEYPVTRPDGAVRAIPLARAAADIQTLLSILMVMGGGKWSLDNGLGIDRVMIEPLSWG